MNLKEETLEILKQNNKSEDDVLWVGNKKQFYSFKEFLLESDFEYDNGFGSNEISMKIVVTGEDFWLERHEYDGSEWWEFKTLPEKPELNEPPELKSSWD